MSGPLRWPPAKHTWREFFMRLLGIKPKPRLTTEEERFGRLLLVRLEGPQ